MSQSTAAMLTPTNTVQPESESEEEYKDEVVDVPYEYEVEEERLREAIKEELVERTIPQVRASYPYNGQGMSVDKGEVGVKHVYVFVSNMCVCVYLKYIHVYGCI